MGNDGFPRPESKKGSKIKQKWSLGGPRAEKGPKGNPWLVNPGTGHTPGKGLGEGKSLPLEGKEGKPG